MNTIPWAKLHGASTHLPIALTLAALIFDLAAVVLWVRPWRRGLLSAGTGAITFAATGAIAAVVTGVVLTRGEVWGDGDLGRHHRFVWPALVVLVAAAVWRLRTGHGLTRRACALYAVVVMVGVILTGGTGYYGGELLQSHL